jgi:mRNA interferase MazF
MKQKDIWLTDLGPVKGSEQSGKRPVIVLSGNALNDHMDIVWVAPISSKIKNYKGHPILSPTKSNGLSHLSEILVFQLKTISKGRFIKKIGVVDDLILNACIKTIGDILKY